MIRVALIARDRLVRQALAVLLEESGLGIVVTLAVGRLDPAKAAQRHQPDLWVIDLPTGALELLGALRRDAGQPEVKVLLLSSCADPQYARKAFARGAQGYLLKREPAEELGRAVRRVMSGGRYRSPSLPPLKPPLTPREQEVLALIARGETNEGIARALGMSIKTVETHRAHLMSKLGARNAADLVRSWISRRRD